MPPRVRSTTAAAPTPGGLRLERGAAPSSAQTAVADRRLYLTADRRQVCEEHDPAAAFLLIPAGGELSLEELAVYGLTVGADGRLVLAHQPDPVATES